MQYGDLHDTAVLTLLNDFGAGGASGRLRLRSADGQQAGIYLKNGSVYAVVVPGPRPALGTRLVTSAVLTPEQLAEAVEAQRTELQGWRLGELLVHLGYVEPPVIEAFVSELLRDGCARLLRWTSGRWKFAPGERTREDVAPPVPVAGLLADLAERAVIEAALLGELHSGDAVPTLGAGGVSAPDVELSAEAWAVLCKVDGVRSVADLSRSCGLTTFEGSQVLSGLLRTGLVDLEAPATADAEDLPPGTGATGAPPASDGLAEVRELLSGLARTGLTGVESTGSRYAEQPEAEDQPPEDLTGPTDSGAIEPDRVPVSLVPPDGYGNEEQTVARASEQLSDALGSGAADGDPFAVLSELVASRPSPEREVAPLVDLAERARRERIRAAAAEELAAAHAHAEASRQEDFSEDRYAAAALLTELSADVADDPQDRSGASGEPVAEFDLGELPVPGEPDEDEQPARPAGDEPGGPARPAGDVEPESPPSNPYQGVPSAPAADTDTASLLRELSSLGLDEPPPPDPVAAKAAPPAPRSAPPAPERSRRRRGLFGRG